MQQLRIRHRADNTADTAAADGSPLPWAAPPSEPVVCTSARDGNVTVELCGELDVVSERPLRRALKDAVSRSVDHVELDLSRVTFCDCSGLNALLAARRHAVGHGKTLTVRAVSPAAKTLLVNTDTWPLFAVTRPTGDALSEDEEKLQTEVTQLRRAMRTRPAIDQATGILMATFSLSPEDAWTVLVAVSQNTNTKLHRIADVVLTTVHGEPLPDAMRIQLAAAVGALRDGDAASG